jgi:hypothetical protein
MRSRVKLPTAPVRYNNKKGSIFFMSLLVTNTDVSALPWCYIDIVIRTLKLLDYKLLILLRR